jgi:hypothetical protein
MNKTNKRYKNLKGKLINNRQNAELFIAKKLLASKEIKNMDKVLLKKVSQRIHPEDIM